MPEEQFEQSMTTAAQSLTGNPVAADRAQQAGKQAPAARQRRTFPNAHGANRDGIAPGAALKQGHFEARFGQARGGDRPTEATAYDDDLFRLLSHGRANLALPENELAVLCSPGKRREMAVVARAFDIHIQTEAMHVCFFRARQRDATTGRMPDVVDVIRLAVAQP
jgi:hypothetical protein